MRAIYESATGAIKRMVPAVPVHLEDDEAIIDAPADDLGDVAPDTHTVDVSTEIPEVRRLTLPESA